MVHVRLNSPHFAGSYDQQSPKPSTPYKKPEGLSFYFLDFSESIKTLFKTDYKKEKTTILIWDF